ncbi:MAG: copper chaperone PCu(A)C [Bacteroidetes bacterium]|nr:copper chaperone PCu(A)C [Bacteroidota bacterium]
MITLFAFLILFYSQGNILQVKNQWLRPGAKGMGTALYFEVENPTDKPDTLYKITSDISSMIQLHETYAKDELMGMREVGEFVIEPESSLELKPGGYHIMVMKLKRDIKKSDEIEFKLHFKNAGSIIIRAKVK